MHIFTAVVSATVTVAYKENIFPIRISVRKGHKLHFKLTLRSLSSIERYGTICIC